MSYYFRERPRFGERFRGKSGDELLQELKQQFADGDDFFEQPRTNGTATRTGPRDPFDRHTSFPRGFPFDEDGFGRRSDIRSHLDELAARHPEFAEQLLGPPWAADSAFPATNSLHRQRNRKPSNDRSSQPDEDTRSQASGSSAASGASAVSSHSSESDKTNMDNPQQRNVRSMSAPPENRQQNNHPERFVSRVDITPQGTPQQANQAQQPQQENSQPANNQQQQQQPQPQSQQREKSPGPQKPQQQGNVRQIPIFVEGRDEPVIAKGFERDEPDFPRRQQSPPQFQRPSHFQQRYQRSPDWASQYMDPFFEQSTGRWPPPPPPPQSQPGFPQFRQPQDKPRSQQTHHPEPSRQQKPQAQSQQKQQTQNEAQPEPPKPKPQIQPKDPLEKVAMVQKEVDALTEQVRQYSGNSRQDKHYMYLDEMLTRELIKLDDIDTEGKDNVRQARKQAIKSIQESISLLESKAPFPGQEQLQQQEEAASQQPPPEEEKKEEEKKEIKEEVPSQSAKEEDKPAEKMETAEIAVVEEQKPAIPLPAPSSLTHPSPVEQPSAAATGAGAEAETSATATAATAPSEPAAQSESSQAATPEAPTATPVETQPEAPKANREPMETAPVEQPKESKPKKEPPPVPAKPKKAKKTKKQPAPVSENAIPLPAPGQSI